MSRENGALPVIRTICSGTAIVSFIWEDINNFYEENFVIKLNIFVFYGNECCKSFYDFLHFAWDDRMTTGCEEYS